jgi:hypothetical protein
MLVRTCLAPRLTRLAVPALLALAAGAASADGASMPSPLGGPWAGDAVRPTFLLVQAPAPADALATGGSASSLTGGGKGAARNKDAAEAVDAPWYGRNNVHKYLGLGSLGAAALTIVSPKKKGGAHERFADAAAVLGVGAVATGGYAHWNDLDFSWSDPDTKHGVFGTLGTLGFLLAVAKGGEGGHAAAGALGAVSMAVAIKYTW